MIFISMERWKNGTRCNILMLFYLLVVHTYVASGACTFPSDIRGNWISSDKGTLNFTSDTIVDYPVNPITVSVNSLSFTCTEQSGDKYLLSSTDTFELFSLPFRAYLCLEIHQISDYKFWYQIGNEIESTNNERFVALLSTMSVDFDNGCARSEPYETSTFNTLVKEGAVDAGLAEATCPYTILHTFSAGSLESATGSTSCNNSTINMCADRTRMIQTYDQGCDSSLKIASGGVSICLLDFTNDTSGVTYLHVWNNDTTLSTGIGRINCYAFVQNGDTFNGTIYPSSCTEEQTDTDVSAPGITFSYDTITNTCQNVVESGPNTIYYVALILGGLVFIFIIVLIICVSVKTKCRCCRKLRKKKKVGQASRITVASYSDTDDDCIDKDSENNDIEANARAARKGNADVMYSIDKEKEDGDIDANARTARTAREKAIEVMFIARKPIKLSPIISPYLKPPAKVELLYDVIPRPMSNKAVLDKSLFMSQVSLRHDR